MSWQFRNRSGARRACGCLALAALGAFLCPAAHAVAVACSVSASAVAFGTYTPLTIAASTGTITITCLSVVGPSPATITLSPGASSTFTARTMSSGGNTLSYNLYLDAAHTQVWGDGTGVSMADNLNLTQGLVAPTTTATVFGLVPSQDPAPGAYTDTITVTVSY
ncbi:MAG TPA: spore coat U domain-containing protein [Steroidobacteraceae bacterium]|jgi:spore coat protein U-like protein|nr:spore coat U domain-containing protein [Steroidobacteraceae bacterium]